MNSDKSLMSSLFEHRQQFSSMLDLAATTPSQATAAQLKAQILIISEWLWTLSAANADVVSGQCLFHPSKYSPLANRAFCAGVLTRNLCHQLNWHGHCAKSLISAALTMDIGLSIDSPELAGGWFNVNKLTKQQQHSYHNHPMTSVTYLHKHQVISKHYLKYIAEHQELLNGSGFPKALRYNQISTPGKILSLVGKFSELISRHPKQPCYSVKQVLRFFAQRADEYCPMLLCHLSVLINKPCLTMTVELAGQQGIIHHVDHQERLVSILELVSIKSDNLVIGTNIINVNFDQIVQIIPINDIYSEEKFNQIWSTIRNECGIDHSNSLRRLTPAPKLSALLNELDQDNPDHPTIARLINQLGQLGDQFTIQLTNQYPNSNFNDSFHALKMAGLQQSKSLLSLLGLHQQLNSYDFPARRLLGAKVDCMIAISRKATDFTSCIQPNQAAIFALLNLAPLYFERDVIQMSSKVMFNFKALTLLDSYSLMALQNTTQQHKISYSLAQRWDNRKPTLKALQMQQQHNGESSLYQDEIISVFQLSLLLTHHIYHGISFDDPLMSIQSKSLFRKMKLSTDNIEQLIASALTQAPLCELSQDLFD